MNRVQPHLTFVLMTSQQKLRKTFRNEMMCALRLSYSSSSKISTAAVQVEKLTSLVQKSEPK